MNNNTTTTTRTVTVSTKYGNKSVQTALNLQDAIKVILADSKASSFALDLASKAGRYVLSPKQADWAVYLAQEALDKQAKPQAPAQGGTSLADSKAIFALFANAHLSLKYPRLRLETADGRLVVIKLSGQGSKHCGSLNLTNGVKYGENGAVFFGYVHQDGTTTIKDQGVLDLLRALAADPAGVTAKQGLASGSCCFCAKALSDSEDGSSEIGYGPICAKHWNLPWTRNGQADVVATAPVKPKRTRKTSKETPVAKLAGKSSVAQSVIDAADAYLAELNV